MGQQSQTLSESLKRAAQATAGRFSLKFTDRHEKDTSYSWQDIWDAAAQRAIHYVKNGIKPGDRIILILGTQVEFLAAFFACQICGAIVVPVYPPVRLGRLDEYYERTAKLMQKVTARLVVTTRRIDRLLGEVFKRYQPELGTMYVDDPVLEDENFRQTYVGAPDDIAVIQFSSGTTADPKPVTLTHRQILANIFSIQDYIQPRADDHAVSWLPLYHDMGLIGGLLTVIESHATLTLIQPEDFIARPALWLRTLSRHHGTVSIGPNFAYELCVARIRDEDLCGVDLTKCRLMLSGAEPVSSGTLTRFAQRFASYGFQLKALKPVYGLAEAALGVAFADRDRVFNAFEFDQETLLTKRLAVEGKGALLVSVGRPLRDMSVAVRSSDGLDFGEGQVGRIHISGPSLSSAYFNQDQVPLVDGWLDSGDEGFLWKGELFITGRAKDMIIVCGKNYAPQDIERALDLVPGVRRGCAAALGVEFDSGEALVLFVETYTPSLELKSLCQRAVLANCGLDAKEIVLLAPGTLPRTSSGKIQRSETLNSWRLGKLKAPRPVNAVTMTLAMVKNVWARIRT